MKLFRNITKAVLAVCLLSAVAACEDEAKFTPATIPTNAQVYFSNTTPATVQVALDDTEYNVPICRVNTAGALDVKLVATGSEFLTVPANVQFADGDSVANFKVTFDANKFGYDNVQTLRIALADSAELATPYGESVMELSLVVPAPWKSLGEAIMVDDIMTGGFNVPVGVPYKVEIQENMITPGHYRLVNPYTSAYPFNEPGDYDAGKNYYLEIHAEDPTAVWFGPTQLGLDWGYGMVSAWSVADFYVTGGVPVEDVMAAGYFGTLVDGEITFPAGGIAYNMPGHPSGGDGWYPTNKNGAFSVLLPGYEKKDYSAAVEYAGVMTSVDGNVYAVANLQLGADAQDVKAVVMTEADDAAAVADALAAGDLEGTAVQAGRIEVPFNAEELGSENLQIVVAVIDKEAAKNVVTAGFEYYGGGENPWKSLGTGTYKESILASLFKGCEQVTYEVEILENSKKPGLYRVMNPYANSVYPFAQGDCAKEGTYLEINACDPEGVYVPQQSLGFDWGEGELFFMSVGYDYLQHYDFETVKANGILGVVDNGVIKLPTFAHETPDGARIPYQGILTMGSKQYIASSLDGFVVTLPGANVPAPAKARSPFVQHLERTFIGKRYVPTVEKRMLKPGIALKGF